MTRRNRNATKSRKTEPRSRRPEPEPKPTRAEQRIRALRRQTKEQGEELKRLRDAVLARPAAQPAAQQPDPLRQAQLDREEVERVAQLPYDEQARYWNRKTEDRISQRLQFNELRTGDLLDQQNFRQVMRDRRLPARYATEVENLLAQARQNNMNPTREWLLKTVIGEEVLSRKDRETERQRNSGRRRIASQTTRPGGAARSTAASAGGRRNQNQDADDEALLRGATLGDVWNSGA